MQEDRHTSFSRRRSLNRRNRGLLGPNDENYEQSLSILANAKKEIFEFFDNVKVNEENETLRKNRLELINMLCKTFQNFINFQLLKTNNE